MDKTENNYLYKIKNFEAHITKYIGKQKSIKIPEFIDSYPVTRICKAAFDNCKISKVIFPNSITKIESFAFCNNKLKVVDFPNSVSKIGMYAFKGNFIKKLVIPNSLSIIEYSCFADNELTEVTFHNSVKKIQQSAFENNELCDISLPDSLKEIGKGVFENNYINEIILKKTVIEKGKIDLLDTTLRIKLNDLQDIDSITSRFMIFEGKVNDIQLSTSKLGNPIKIVNIYDNEDGYSLLLANENFDNFNSTLKQGKRYEICGEIIQDTWCLGGFRKLKIKSIVEK